jgi:hypothetical protein
MEPARTKARENLLAPHHTRGPDLNGGRGRTRTCDLLRVKN